MIRPDRVSNKCRCASSWAHSRSRLGAFRPCLFSPLPFLCRLPTWAAKPLHAQQASWWWQLGVRVSLWKLLQPWRAQNEPMRRSTERQTVLPRQSTPRTLRKLRAANRPRLISAGGNRRARQEIANTARNDDLQLTLEKLQFLYFIGMRNFQVERLNF